MNQRWTDEEDAQLRSLRAQELPNAVIATAMGRSLTAIKVRCAKLGLTKRPPPRKPKPKGVPVPVWVPSGLKDEYVAVAEIDGEFAAASWARAEKRAMAA